MTGRSQVWDASDEALLAGMAVGDRDAALGLVRRFQQRVYGLARVIVGDVQLAEDIAQEAFYRAWRSAATYDARRGSVTTWLLTITRNLAIDALRMRLPEPIDPDSIIAAALAAPGSDPAQAAMEADEARRMRVALADLCVEQRRAVVLAVYLGYTAREIGETEGIPLGTAKTRIRTGLIRLRAALSPRGGPTDDILDSV